MPGQRLTGEGIEQALASMEYGGVEDPLSASHWPRGTGRPLRFLISDLLFPVSMERHLSTLRRDAAALVVIQVLSRTERDPSFTGGLRLVDAESPARKRDLRVDRGVLRRYRGRLATHLGSIDGAARKVGALVVRVDVDDLFRDATSIRDALVPPLLERGIVEVA